MIAGIRALTRACLIALVTLGLYTLLLVGLAFTGRRTAAGSRRLVWVRWIYQRWARTLMRLFGGRVEVRGVPPVPPYLLVSNHLSFVDIVLLACFTETVFIAKAEIGGWPFFGRACRTVGTLFVDRERRRDVVRVGALMTEALERGRGLVLFPEGTTSRGVTVEAFKPALLAPVAEADLPVHYAALSYRTEPGGPTPEEVICWWGDMPFLPQVWKLLKLRHFSACVTFGEETFRHRDRKELARSLHGAVLAAFRAQPGQAEAAASESGEQRS